MTTAQSRHIANLAQLVRDGLYPVDSGAVAEAICARRALRAVVPVTTIRAEERRAPRVRSFHPTRSASSFRLARR